MPGPVPQNAKLGIAWMLLTMLLFVSMDVSAKYLVQTYDVVQVVWARYFFHMLILLIVLAPRIRRLAVTGHLKLQLFRSVLLLGTTLSFFTGLRFVQMADASAIMLASPIVVTALSMPILREHVGARRWVSVLIGCIGALVIIRPGTGMMQAASLFPLAAAMFFGAYQISTRFLSQSESILTTLLYTAVIGAIVMTFAVPFFWQTPTTFDWMVMVLLAVFGGLGHFTMIKALTIAPAATIVPFTYTNLIWATLFGFIFFDDLPDQLTIIGASIIVSSGLYIFHREHRKTGS